MGNWMQRTRWEIRMGQLSPKKEGIQICKMNSEKQKPPHFFYSDKELKGKRKNDVKIWGTVCTQECTAMSPCTKRLGKGSRIGKWKGTEVAEGFWVSGSFSFFFLSVLEIEPGPHNRHRLDLRPISGSWTIHTMQVKIHAYLCLDTFMYTYYSPIKTLIRCKMAKRVEKLPPHASLPDKFNPFYTVS